VASGRTVRPPAEPRLHRCSCGQERSAPTDRRPRATPHLPATPVHDATRKVEVFVIGAPKCATDAISRAIALHPQIAFCDVKEPRFFSHDGCFSQGIDWYHGFFGDAPGLRAEASTSYGEAWQDRHRISADRIHAYNPSARIIYCVRHPLQRAVSEWREIGHQLRLRNPSIGTKYGIHDQTTVDADLQAVPGYLDTSNYWQTIGMYRRHFDDSRIHIVFQENWARTPRREFACIMRFIGIDHRFVPPDIDVVFNDKWIKARPRLPLSMVRKLPDYFRWTGQVPRTLRRLTQPLLKHPPDGGMGVSETTRIFARQRIGPDIERFLEWRGLPPHLWSW
jgi:hypothetical protein